MTKPNVYSVDAGYPAWFESLTVSGMFSSRWSVDEKEALLATAVSTLDTANIRQWDMNTETALTLLYRLTPVAEDNSDFNLFFYDNRPTFRLQAKTDAQYLHTELVYSFLAIMHYGDVRHKGYVQAFLSICMHKLSKFPTKRLSDDQVTFVKAVMGLAIKFQVVVSRRCLRYYFQIETDLIKTQYLTSMHASDHLDILLAMGLQPYMVRTLLANGHCRSDANNKRALSYALTNFDFDADPSLFGMMLRMMVAGYSLTGRQLATLKRSWRLFGRSVTEQEVDAFCAQFDSLSLSARRLVDDMVMLDQIASVFAVKLFGTETQVAHLQYYMLQHVCSEERSTAWQIQSVPLSFHNSDVTAFALSALAPFDVTKLQLRKWGEFKNIPPFGIVMPDDAVPGQYVVRFGISQGVPALTNAQYFPEDTSIVSWVKSRLLAIIAEFGLTALSKHVQDISSLYATLPYMPEKLKGVIRLLNYGKMDAIKWLHHAQFVIKVDGAESCSVPVKDWFDLLDSITVDQYFHEALRFFGVKPSTEPNSPMRWQFPAKLQRIAYSDDLAKLPAEDYFVKAGLPLERLVRMLPLCVVAYAELKQLGIPLKFEQLPVLAQFDTTSLVEMLIEVDNVYDYAEEREQSWVTQVTKSDFVSLLFTRWFNPLSLMRCFTLMDMSDYSPTTSPRNLVDAYVNQFIGNPPNWLRQLLSQWDKQSKVFCPNRDTNYPTISFFHELEELVNLVVAAGSVQTIAPRNIPSIESKFDHNGQRYTVRVLDRHDPLALYVGELSGCCQHVNGAACELAALSADDDNVAVLVIESSVERIVAQSCIWVTSDELGRKYIAIDSIESVFKEKDPMADVIMAGYTVAVQALHKAGFNVLISPVQWASMHLLYTPLFQASNPDSEIDFEMIDYLDASDFDQFNCMVLTTRVITG